MIEDFTQANSAITTLYVSEVATLSEELAAKFLALASSPIMPEKVSQIPELVYANADQFSTEAKATAADVCSFATSFQFYGLGDEQRGNKITASLRGETVEDAPEPKADLIIAAPSE